MLDCCYMFAIGRAGVSAGTFYCGAAAWVATVQPLASNGSTHIQDILASLLYSARRWRHMSIFKNEEKENMWEENVNSTWTCEEQRWCDIVVVGVYMVKHSTHLILAVSGHKYPHGEHTPAEVQGIRGYPTLNNFNLKRGQVMYGVWGVLIYQHEQ